MLRPLVFALSVLMAAPPVPDLTDQARFGSVVSEAAIIRVSSTSPWDEPEHHLALVGAGHEPFAFHTAEETSPWVWIDLGSPQLVTALEIDNRTDGNGVRTTRLDIAVSTDAVHWTDVTTLSGPEPRWSVSLLDGDKPREARYVRVLLPSKGFLHLSRARVWARANRKAN